MARTNYNTFILIPQTLLILLCLIAFTSCNSSTSNKKKIGKLDKIDSAITDNHDIIGHWSMYGKSTDSMEVSHSINPIFIFSADGSGSIKMAHFKWAFKKDRLQVLPDIETQAIFFTDTTYAAFITKDNNTTRLTIQQLKGNERYYLLK